MIDYTIIIVALITLIIGFLVGKYIENLKQKTLKEQNNLLLNQFNTYKHDVLKTQEESRIATTNYNQKIEQQINKLQEEKEAIRNQKDTLSTQLAQRNTEFENLHTRSKEQKEELERLQEKFTKEFENLANKILEEKSEKFTHQNKENIKHILQPLEEKIKTFEKKVDDTQKENISMHSALKQQLVGLKDLNQKMSQEANNLTKALKGDTKTQGNWGELVLERVLEKSGLEKGREYVVQQNFTREDGSRVLPDVVINLPDNKKMIIDSKVSLINYERYVNSNESEQDIYLKAHINAIKKHVEQLSAKNYQDLYTIESPDFVLMFIPIEPAFAVALNQDNTLYNKAFEKNIVIVTPTTLLATLRTIDTMWNNDKQQRNAIKIATEAGKLYDQFVNLTDELIKVGNQLNTVKGSYDSTMKKLTGRGNLLTKVENMKKLGIKANKQINEKLIKKTDELE